MIIYNTLLSIVKVLSLLLMNLTLSEQVNASFVQSGQGFLAAIFAYQNLSDRQLKPPSIF